MDITPARLCLALAMLVFALAAFWRPPNPAPFNMVAAARAAGPGPPADVRGEALRWLRLLVYVFVAVALAYVVVTAGPGQDLRPVRPLAPPEGGFFLRGGPGPLATTGAW